MRHTDVRKKQMSVERSIKRSLASTAERWESDYLREGGVGAAMELWESLNTPLSLSLYLLAKGGEVLQLLDKRPDPNHYLNLEDFASDHAACNFIRKAPLLVEGVDRSAQALGKFVTAEQACADTNQFLRSYRRQPKLMAAWLHEVLHLAVRLISDCLGDLDEAEWANSCRFGPGATTGLARRRSSTYNKLVDLSSTREGWSTFEAMFCNEGPWADYLASQQVDRKPRIGRIEFVPKDALTDRTICVEPGLNVFLQKGLGKMIRRRLRQVGVNLNRQEDNQRLAQFYSKTGQGFTIDLSSASDTISVELVRELLPEPWFDALDRVRTKRALLPSGEVLWLEKFSAMGNGFTFELESLLFWALTEASVRISGAPRYIEGRRTVRVFGDDILGPSQAFDLLSAALKRCGFEVNARKSFNSSPFRESCGGDYWEGRPIRPHAIKSVGRKYLDHLKLVNGLRSKGASCASQRVKQAYHSLWHKLIASMPRSLRRICVPGDFPATSGVIVSLDELYYYAQLDIYDPSKLRSPYVSRHGRGWDGWVFPSIMVQTRLVRYEDFDRARLTLLYKAMVRSGGHEDQIDDFLPTREVILDPMEVQKTEGDIIPYKLPGSTEPLVKIKWRSYVIHWRDAPDWGLNPSL